MSFLISELYSTIYDSIERDVNLNGYAGGFEAATMMKIK
jgi:hypothetical protein